MAGIKLPLYLHFHFKIQLLLVKHALTDSRHLFIYRYKENNAKKAKRHQTRKKKKKSWKVEIFFWQGASLLKIGTAPAKGGQKETRGRHEEKNMNKFDGKKGVEREGVPPNHPPKDSAEGWRAPVAWLESNKAQ